MRDQIVSLVSEGGSYGTSFRRRPGSCFRGTTGFNRRSGLAREHAVVGAGAGGAPPVPVADGQCHRVHSAQRGRGRRLDLLHQQEWQRRLCRSPQGKSRDLWQFGGIYLAAQKKGPLFWLLFHTFLPPILHPIVLLDFLLCFISFVMIYIVCCK